MGLLEPDRPSGGGATVLDRPRGRTEERDWRYNMRLNARSVSCLVHDRAEVMGFSVDGEVEPRHDGRYERHTITLRRDGDLLVNANEFEFACSIQWSGPVVAFLVHDGEGKAVGRSNLSSPMPVEPGIVFAIPDGVAAFYPLDHPDA